MADDLPTISVIVAVYNGAATLQRCLDSITRQTYAKKELIVMDGSSTDGTVDILKANSDKISYWESEKDRGMYHAWNKAVERATGEWICFLGCDDRFWDDSVLERLSVHLPTAYPPIRLVHGQNAQVSRAGEVIRYRGEPWDRARKGILHTLTIPHSGAMHHRSLFEVHGNFDESFRIVGDYDLLLCELRTGEALFVPGIIVVAFQYGGMTNSPETIVKLTEELKRLRQKHGIRYGLTNGFTKVSLKMAICALVVRRFGPQTFTTVSNAFRRLRGRPEVWGSEQ